MMWSVLSSEETKLQKKIRKRRMKLLKAEVKHKNKKVRKHERKLIKLLCKIRHCRGG